MMINSFIFIAFVFFIFPSHAVILFDDRSLNDITYRWDYKHKDSLLWSKFTEQAINEHGLLDLKDPEDAKEFCSNFKNLKREQKKLFWIYLFSSIAELESSFKPNTSYTEDFNDSSGKKVISRGLLQISEESAKLYDCQIEKATDLFDPQTNLDCGARILTYWLDRDERIAGKVGSKWLGAGRYWSVFRHKVAKIKGWTKSIEFCN